MRRLFDRFSCLSESRNNMRRQGIFLSALLTGLLACAGGAMAWNKAGHMVVGEITYQDLKRSDPAALEKVVGLLKQHPQYPVWEQQMNTRGLAGEDRDLYLFLQAGRWADDIRGNGQYDRPDWHYVNFPYQPGSLVPAQAPEGTSILTAFKLNQQVLQSDAPSAEKAVALTWLFHLVGDVHQPLHVVKLVTDQYPEGDRGGTRFYIRVRPGSGTISLHKFWDDLIQGSENLQDVRTTAIELRNRPEHKREAFGELAVPDFDHWAGVESLGLAQAVVYRGGTLAASTNRSDGAILPADYPAVVKSVAERRAVLAGYRMADLLSKSF